MALNLQKETLTVTTAEIAAEAERTALAADTGQPVTTHLPPRFADYLAARAQAHGETPERHLGSILRLFWQNDPWRQIDSRPTDTYQPAGTGRR